MLSTPIVSVVTPFYNSAEFLRTCVESVLEQSYTHFEYVLLDNCSTDESRAIAESYARRDSRLRVYAASNHVPQIPNYNRALALISPESHYCKIVQADDAILPHCISRMVEVAESGTAVGLVAASTTYGTSRRLLGKPHDVGVWPGAEAARRRLLSPDTNFDGNPTAVMYRSSLVRERPQFFQECRTFEDVEICFEILNRWEYAFVGEPLSWIRTDNDSILTRIRNADPAWLAGLELVLAHHYADRFFTPREAGRLKRKRRAEYARAMASSPDRDHPERSRFRDTLLREAGVTIPPWEVVAASLKLQLGLWPPLRAVNRLRRSLARTMNPAA